VSVDHYEFEDVACNVLRVGPLLSATWTVEIRPLDGEPVSVIMTRGDLLALADAARDIGRAGV
jgi:hypothetical protein